MGKNTEHGHMQCPDLMVGKGAWGAGVGGAIGGVVVGFSPLPGVGFAVVGTTVVCDGVGSDEGVAVELVGIDVGFNVVGLEDGLEVVG